MVAANGGENESSRSPNGAMVIFNERFAAPNRARPQRAASKSADATQGRFDGDKGFAPSPGLDREGPLSVLVG